MVMKFPVVNGFAFAFWVIDHWLRLHCLVMHVFDFNLPYAVCRQIVIQKLQLLKIWKTEERRLFFSRSWWLCIPCTDDNVPICITFANKTLLLFSFCALFGLDYLCRNVVCTNNHFHKFNALLKKLWSYSVSLYKRTFMVHNCNVILVKCQVTKSLQYNSRCFCCYIRWQCQWNIYTQHKKRSKQLPICH